MIYFKYVNKDNKYYTRTDIKSDVEQYSVIKKISYDWETSIDENNLWKFYLPQKKYIQEQGWKIHISANLDNAQETLDIVSEILEKYQVSFKHIIDKDKLRMLNCKTGNRVSSGKFITIYPQDSVFVELLHKLYDALKLFERGPYILSDKCWKSSNIYYRYGGFKPIYSEDGELCIKDNNGNLVPDKRNAYYYIPPFIEEPEELSKNNKEDLTSNNESCLSKYKVKSCLRFSNSGGVYLAERKSDNKKVIIKEGRFRAGLDGNDRDAIERIDIENKYISRLSSVDGIVNIIECFKTWDNKFLVEEYVEGMSFTHWISKNYPFHINQDEKVYTDKIKKIILKLKEIVTNMHEHNVGMGDLQPSNIIIGDNLEVTLIDFESANESTVKDKCAMLTLGFANELNENNRERDLYGIKKILRYAFLPIGPIDIIDKNVILYHNDWIIENFGMQTYEFIKEIENECDKHLTKTKEYANQNNNDYTPEDSLTDLNSIIEKLGKGLLSDCNRERSGLIHGDVRQYETSDGEINILSGGFGAILALVKTGILDETCTKWIEDKLETYNLEDISSGLFTGKAGIATTLYEAGFKDKALEIFNGFNDNYNCNDISLRSGLSGIGLSLAYLYLETNDERYLNECNTIFKYIKTFIDKNIDIDIKDWSAVPIGIIDGWCGVSIFTSTLYMITGDEKFYDLSVDLINKDLINTRIEEDLEIIQTVDKKGRLLPYLSGGTIGIGAAIWYLNKVSNNELYKKELDLIINTNKLRITFNSGLFDGAGSFLIIPALIDKDSSKSKLIEINSALNKLNVHLIKNELELLCPGNLSYKLSSDLYSGNAGLILALNGILKSNPLFWLPIININFINEKECTNNEK